MRNYDIYFELFGKKMKTSIMANNEQEAKDNLFKKIVFHKVTLNKKDYFNRAMDTMDEVCEVLNVNKPKF